jgi:hypothetical protein
MAGFSYPHFNYRIVLVLKFQIPEGGKKCGSEKSAVRTENPGFKVNPFRGTAQAEMHPRYSSERSPIQKILPRGVF